jgi:hypothetical protein
VLLGAHGLVSLILLAAADGGSPTDRARAMGGFMKRRLGQFFTPTEMMRSSAAERLGPDNTPPPSRPI